MVVSEISKLGYIGNLGYKRSNDFLFPDDNTHSYYQS